MGVRWLKAGASGLTELFSASRALIGLEWRLSKRVSRLRHLKRLQGLENKEFSIQTPSDPFHYVPLPNNCIARIKIYTYYPMKCMSLSGAGSSRNSNPIDESIYNSLGYFPCSKSSDHNGCVLSQLTDILPDTLCRNPGRCLHPFA